MNAKHVVLPSKLKKLKLNLVITNIMNTVNVKIVLRRKSSMRKLMIWGVFSSLLFLFSMGAFNVLSHQERYRDTELYLITSIDADGYYHAKNYDGMVVFLPENVQGSPVFVGATVMISLNLSGEEPLVELY
jgi:hypothetical protein